MADSESNLDEIKEDEDGGSTVYTETTQGGKISPSLYTEMMASRPSEASSGTPREQMRGMFNRRSWHETKGSLTLHSNHLMGYGKTTMINNWHHRREADPLDFDLKAATICDKDYLRRSSYKRIGDSKEEHWTTTTGDILAQINLKKEFTEREIPKSLINADNIDSAITKRETGLPERGFGAVLPHHHPDQSKMFLKTTYSDEFEPPYRYTPAVRPPDRPTYPSPYGKCHSQFTDTADYRRFGINTWQDDGMFCGHSKRNLFKKTNPILPSL